MLMIADPVPSSLAADSLHRLEENMQKVLDDWKVPGLALFLLKDGEMVLARGFGKRNVAEKLTHLHYDIFEVFIKLAQYKTPVAFTSGEKGKIENLTVKLEQAVKPIVFTRVEY
ncbi:MAG TPA: hypothetical protein VFN35_19620, partial [Ktedonobacteraceae bacterium]|nr:hypothetical protein [Ktedonobacteraceae bacterium]